MAWYVRISHQLLGTVHFEFVFVTFAHKESLPRNILIPILLLVKFFLFLKLNTCITIEVNLKFENVIQ